MLIQPLRGKAEWGVGIHISHGIRISHRIYEIHTRFTVHGVFTVHRVARSAREPCAVL